MSYDTTGTNTGLGALNPSPPVDPWELQMRPWISADHFSEAREVMLNAVRMVKHRLAIVKEVNAFLSMRRMASMIDRPTRIQPS